MNAFTAAAVKPAPAVNQPAQNMTQQTNNPLRLPNDRWSALEIAFWLLPVAAYFAFPGYLVLITKLLPSGSLTKNCFTLAVTLCWTALGA